MPETLHIDPRAAALDPGAALANMANGDPRLAMLMQLMQARRTAEADDAPAAEDQAAAIAELTERLEAAEARIARMNAAAGRLLARARADARRLSELAAALGACGLCWGEDVGCPSCRGRGRAGMVRPDPELRRRILGPRREGQARPDPADH